MASPPFFSATAMTEEYAALPEEDFAGWKSSRLVLAPAKPTPARASGRTATSTQPWQPQQSKAGPPTDRAIAGMVMASAARRRIHSPM